MFILVIKFFQFVMLLTFSSYSFAMFNEGLQNKKSVTQADIYHFYDKWKGVQYRFGGSSKEGIDCSALTQLAFSKLGISLPRTTSEQLVVGKHVPKYDLRLGDLVFFKIDENQRHVGVYVGDGKFMHASTKKGVTISLLGNKYWAERYEISKRIVS